VAEPRAPGTTTDTVPGAWQPYRAILLSRLRSQLSYRTSFAFDVATNLAFGLVGFLEIYIIFHNVPALGGLDWRASLLVLALSQFGFATADLLVGHLDQIAFYLRTGTLETLLLRPLPVLSQLVLTDISLRRIARVIVYAAVLALTLPTLDIDWTPARAALLIATLVGSSAIFSAVFIAAGASQFRLIDAGEFTNAVTYGGGYAGSFSAQAFPLPLRVFFTVVVPATFTGYLPALVLLGRDGPPGTPAWLGWLTLPVSAAAMAAAFALWARGVRYYQGGGG
jgi:ABC-2 type transport system permease protein